MSQIWIVSGVTSNSTTVNDGDDLYVYSGGTANSTTVNDGGDLHVYSGGTASSTLVNDGGALWVESGGTATEIHISQGGELVIYMAPGTYVQGISLSSCFEVIDGFASGLVINPGIYINVESGGTAINTIVSGYNENDDWRPGYLMVNGGCVYNTIADAYCVFSVSGGGTVHSTTIRPDGRLEVYSGGTANDTIVHSQWCGFDGLHVFSGGTANRNTVEKEGLMTVYEEGVANSTVVTSRGCLIGYGEINGLTINSSGYAYIYGGAVFSGSIDLYDASQIYVVEDGIDASNAIFNFHVETHKTDDDFFVSIPWYNEDYVGVRGVQGGTFVITVDSSQDYGIYKIAQGAAAFNKTITLKNESGAELGVMTVNGDMLVSDGVGYALRQSDGNLTLRISGSGGNTSDWTAPVLGDWIEANVEEANVTVTWDAASDNVGVLGYQFRYGTSRTLNGNGVTVEGTSYQLSGLDEGIYYCQIRAFDAAGNYSEWSDVERFAVGDFLPVYVQYSVPQAEYMYGCTATVIGMMLGYYDRFGYMGYDVSNLIEGTAEINARGLDGNAYDMDAFDTVLGRAIASPEYVSRFVDATPAHEYPYTFVGNTTELNVSAWNCIADYLGTGQYWRGNEDLSTSLYYDSLEDISQYDFTEHRSGGGISVDVPAKYSDLLYGLSMYVQQAGYQLDTAATMTVLTDNNGGSFSFDDYMSEIDSGRLVMVSVEGHSMLGYGYDPLTNEIIFDDTYRHDCRMEWGGVYYYSNAWREMQSVTIVQFDTTNLSAKEAPDGQVHSGVVVSSGVLEIWNGDVANDTTVMAGGEAFVYQGGMASGMIVAAEGYLDVDGGVVSDTTVNQDGELRVHDGGIANYTIVNYDGYMGVLEGGVANYTTVNGIYTSGGYDINGRFHVGGGTANSTTVNAYGWLELDVSGTANDTIVNSSAGIDVYGIANRTTLNSGGYMYVGEEGTANGVIINQGAYVQFCGTAIDVVENGGMVDVVEGAHVTFASNVISGVVLEGCSTTIHSGTIASDVSIVEGTAEIFDGGVLNGGTASSDSVIYVYEGGLVENVSAFASNWTDGDGRYHFLSGSIIVSGGVANDNTLIDGGETYLESGGVANRTRVASGAELYVAGGGIANDTIVNNNGQIDISEAGTANATMVSGGGTMSIYSSGVANGTIMSTGGCVNVNSGGIANGIAASGGWVNVSSGGVVSSAIIGSGASMSLREGAIAYDLTVEQGGIVYSWPLGYMRGVLTIGGRVQDISGNGIVGVSSYIFNVQTQLGDAFLSFSSGGIAANANITIDVGNAWGNYTLVKGSLGNLSSATITVKSGEYSTAISANGSATLGDGRNVRLTKGTNAWNLAVTGTDNTPPLTPANLTSSIEENMLNISWEAVQDFSGVKYEMEYSRNEDFSNSSSKLFASPNASLSLSNGTWHWRLRSVDGAGNTSPWTNWSDAVIDFSKRLEGELTATETAYSDVTLAQGTSIKAYYPGCVQLPTGEYTVTLLGDNALSCSSIRNAAILFGDDAYWGDFCDGIVTFEGTNITLHSDVSNCITAAGIKGNNLTVNFNGAASGAESIVFEASNGSYGPGNFATGVQAAGNLTVNGDFGGTITGVLDCRGLNENRSGRMTGFDAEGDLVFNGGMDGQIYLAGYACAGSDAYGLYAGGGLTVNGDVGGIIMATAQNGSYGLYGDDALTASISGIVFAGKSSAANDKATLAEKLKHFGENSAELLGLAKSSYSVYTYGKAELAFTDEALVVGNIRVGSNSQISISSGASIYGDFTANGSTALQFVLDDASLEGTRWTMSKWSSYLSMSVNADDVSSDGAYSLVGAKDLSSVSGITMTVDGRTLNLKANDSVNVNGVTYSLANQKTSSKHTLVLTVSGSAMKDREVPVLNGQIQVQQGVGRNATLTWQAATDNVGVKGYELKWDGQVRTVEQTTYTMENITAGTHTCQIRAFDEAGNYSDWSAEQNVVFVDSAAPVLKSIVATPSEPTNQDVSIFVEYEDDFGICNVQYRFGDDDDWRAYDSQVLVTSNAIVSFRALDETGNVSDVTQFQVSNIDKEAPEAPTATASTTLPTNQDVIVTATFSEDTEQRQYSLDGQKWSAYTDGVAMAGNGTIYFRGIDAAGNVSDVTSCTVSNIDKVAPVVSNLDVSEPNADGIVTIALTASEPLSQLKYSWNGDDWVDFPGNELCVSERGIVSFLLVDAVGNETITEGYFVSTIIPTADDWTDLATNGPDSDEIGNFGVAEIGASFIEEIGKDDKIDYMAIELESAASLSFTVSSVNAAKFTIYQLLSKESKGVTTYSLKSMQATTLKANVATTTKNLLLEAGTYYIGVAANDKKSADELYTIAVSDKSVFFTEGDNSDDWTEMKTRGAEGLAATLGTVTAESGTLVEDGWVGYGDAIDYAAFTLDSAASLAFDLNATDAAKFTIYQLQSKVSKNVTTYSLKSLQSTTLKANVKATTKDLLLEEGTYYVAMEGTNAKKGGSADYTIALGAKSKFYTAGDNSDDWTTMKTAGAEGLEATLGVVTAESEILRNDGWVGFGDAFDYAAFTLGSAASLAFDLTSTDAAKFTVYQLQSKESKGVTTYSLKSLQSTTLKANVNATTKNLLLEKGTYYVAMESTSAKKGGDADYTIAASEKSAFFTGGNNDDDAWNAAELPDFGGEWEDWTGYGDAIDYRRMVLETPARLALDLAATDATKFTVWQLDAKTNKLKSIQATTLKANKDKTQYTASPKELLLNGGTYYISMECTTAKKGGSADFTVVYGDRYELFENCDNSNDTWKAVASNDAAAIGDVLNGWVGFGDTADFYKFEVAEAGKLSLTFDEETEAAVKAKQLKLSCLDAKGKAVSLAAFKDGSVASSKALAAGEYYLGITCTNVQKYDTSYNVSLGMLA
ncbi:MAG: AIDA repeat-containing protein [Victivallales bacterium]|nr:AIDA repeat-containing protein [Victivallales bacterium]